MPPFVSSPRLTIVQRASGRRIRTLLLTGAGISALVVGQALAGGVSGGKVVYGNASINYGGQNTTISQSTQKALIDWNSFSIPSGSGVSFLQPNSSSITLNRVLGASPSVIDGSLFATGNVWLINSNGVLFGKGSQINVGGLIATTADMRNSDFISGNYNFSIASPNPNASVVNQGTIKTARGGTAILAGTSVNNQGLIQADMGNVVLAGASTFSVDFTGDNLLRFEVVDPVKQTPKNADGTAKAALVSNSGTISANGGHVLMTARAASNVVDNVVNNTGMIQATSVSSKNGEIILDAGDGTVEAGGTIDASGTASGETGGSVKVLGKTVEVADGAKIDASGAAGGGSILIGGNFQGKGSEQNADTTTIGNATIKADALQKGDGGKIAVWSNKQTVFNGSISARGGAQGGNGGFVETSGAINLKVNKTAKVDTLASHGKTGTWLLDPENIDIVSGGQDGLGGSEIDPTTIINALASTNVELKATNDIDIDSVVAYSSANAFTLLAGHDIDAKASVQNAGTGAINLIAGWDGKTTDLDLLTNTGVYGNNGGSVIIGTDSAHGDVSIGSFGGITTVAGANIVVDAQDGIAQIGYHGPGGGNIDVLATANVVADSSIATYALIGNGGSGVSGNITGDISVTTFGGTIGLQSDSLDESNLSIASIGNLGGNGASESGNITINTNGGALQLNAVGVKSIVRVGNWTRGNTSGTSSGNITINTGTLLLDAGATEQQSGTDYAEIGNGSFNAGSNTGALSGNISINAASLIMDAIGTNGAVTAQTRIGNLGNGNVSGNLNIAATSDLEILASGGGIANIGSVTQGTGVTTSGNTTIVSGGGITLAAQDGGEARIEAGGINGTMIVTAQGDIVLSTENDTDFNSLAFIGNFGNGGNVTVTSKLGSVELLADSTGGSVQIGNKQIQQNASVGGDVAVVAHNDVEVSATGDGAFAQIGNSNGSSVSGDVSVRAGQALQLAGETQALIGNLNLGEPLSGSTTITARSVSDDITAILFSDLSYGDFALNLTGTSALILPVEADYSSAHALSISNGGDIVFAASLQNAGTGDINISSAGTILIGGQQALGSVAVGSFGGTTTITGTNVIVEADNGYAQIGYHGASSGAINVSALAGVSVLDNAANFSAQIGNGGRDVTGGIGGDISVTAAAILVEAASASESSSGFATIGNLGTGNSSESGDITIDTGSTGTVALNAAGFTNVAQIGNWNSGQSTGTISGDIQVNTGVLSVISGVAGQSDEESYDFAGIGNGNIHHFGANLGGVSGDITINAATITLDAVGDPELTALNEARIGNIGLGLVTGDVNVTTTGDISIVSDVAGVASIGDSSAPLDSNDNPLQGNYAGNLTVQAGGNVSVIAENGGEARIASVGLTAGSVSVTANGNILLSADSTADAASTAFIGSLITGNGGGDVTVISTHGSIQLNENGEDGLVQIGNAGVALAGQVGGNVTVTATDALNGSVTLSGQDGQVLVGNSGIAGSSVSGDVTLTAANALNLTGNQTLIGNDNPGGPLSGSTTINAAFINGDIGPSLVNDLLYGDFSLNLTSANPLILPVAVDYSSSHALSIANGGDILFLGSLENFGTGDLTVHAGGSVIIGGANAQGGVAVGSLGGTTTVTGTDIILDAENGYAQIGYAGGGGSGNINVSASRNIVMTASQAQDCQSCYVQIGNGGVSVEGNNSGDIDVGAGNSITLLAGAGATSYAQIGNGGDGGFGNASGTISLTAGGALTMTGLGDYAAIGNGGRGMDGNASGDISVSVGGGLTMTSGSGFGFVQIGNGAADDSVDGTASGNITINVAGATSLSSVGDGTAWVGNVAEGGETGDLTLVTGALNASSDLLNAMLAADLGTGVDNGGNVTVGITGGSDTIVSGGVEYASANTLSILSAGNVIFLGSLQNDGNGAINVVAGWNGATLDPALFTSAGVFGNNGGSIVIGGNEALGNVAVGSAGGMTTLAASSVSLLANNGYAQLGYHGAGSGGITIDASDTVTLTGGSGDGQHYAQIGNGGQGVNGNESGDIAINAGGDIVLTGGDGNEAYAQIGHGGAESNKKQQGYALSGNITLVADNVTLAAGTGSASFAQIGHGGFMSGSGLSGEASIGGNISIAASGAVLLTGNGNDAYTQIGNGGDQVNINAAAGSSASINGNIVVVAGDDGGVTLAAGSGANAYAQIGNGGYDINGSNGSSIDSFTIGGNISVSDLSLTGGDTGANSFAQVGNGDASNTGFANVSGDITIAANGKITLTNGKAQNSQALIGNAIGTGTVTGTVTGDQSGGQIDPQDPVLNGVVATTIADNNPSDLIVLTGDQQPVLIEEEPVAPVLVAEAGTGSTAPLAELAGENVEGTTASDSLTLSVAKSLSNAKPTTSRVLLGGSLREFSNTTNRSPHGVPSADQEFSSWGNEALWQ